MKNRIGLRLEDINQWERRVALIPDDVKELVAQGVEIWVESFARRTFGDAEYAAAGAKLVRDVTPCELVLGIKGMPNDYFRPEGAYLFFSHTIKGQPYTMPMLANMVERRCTLMDYETVVDEHNRRLIFFGYYAGLAGMVDTLWTLGQRLAAQGCRTPFLDLCPVHTYANLEQVKAAVTAVGQRIANEALPESLAPLVVGFAGYGNVSQGAQEIFDLLPTVEVRPGELAEFVRCNRSLTTKLVKVVYREEHLVERINPSRPFELQEYYDHPERYRSTFGPHLDLLTVLVNGIFWTEKYPKLGDADQLRALFRRAEKPRLSVIGDITCDVDGSLACTVRDTDPGDPVYIYDPETRKAVSGFEGPGLAVMAVGSLPCELPRESSRAFSKALKPYIPAMAAADLSGSFETVELPDPIHRSVILWRGQFTPRYEYMKDFLR